MRHTACTEVLQQETNVANVYAFAALPGMESEIRWSKHLLASPLLAILHCCCACRREEVRLEAQEADNIQLNQGLLRACAAERSLFCSAVQPGSARVFRCLAHNLASADFGRGCMNAMMTKLRRREANWRLDPPLRKACTVDVERWVALGCGLSCMPTFPPACCDVLTACASSCGDTER